MRKLFSAVLLCLALPLANANAGLVEFDLDNSVALGQGLDSQNGSFLTPEGITFTASATGPDAVPNSVSTGLGVNSSVTGDSASQIDPGETLSIAFTFDANDFEKVSLSAIDFGNISTVIGQDEFGEDIGEQGTVTLPDGSTLTYSRTIDLTGTGFSADLTTDVVTADTPIDLVSGDTLVFSNPNLTAGEFRIQSLTFHIEPVAASIPEPSSLALFGLLGLGVATRRRR